MDCFKNEIIFDKSVFRNDKLIKSFYREIEAWEFDRDKFEYARLDAGIKPPVAPLWWNLATTSLPSVSKLEKAHRMLAARVGEQKLIYMPKDKINKGFIEEDVYKARIWQFNLGFLREFDLILRVLEINGN